MLKLGQRVKFLGYDATVLLFDGEQVLLHLSRHHIQWYDIALVL